MNKLSGLIDHLYKEGIEEGQLLTHEELSNPNIPLAGNLMSDLNRLRDVIEQMGSLLYSEKIPEPNTQDATLLEHSQILQLMQRWDSLCNDIEGLKKHIRSLEVDIIRMQPWGDFDVVKVEKLKAHGCHIRFWIMRSEIISAQKKMMWYSQYNVFHVNQDADWDYFVTVTQQGDKMEEMPSDALEQEICPCPASTLIMLQTRDKDSLKQKMSEQRAFAFDHYAELYNTFRQISLPDTPMPQFKTEKHRLRNKIKKLFKR